MAGEKERAIAGYTRSQNVNMTLTVRKRNTGRPYIGEAGVRYTTDEPGDNPYSTQMIRRIARRAGVIRLCASQVQKKRRRGRGMKK